MMGHSESPAAAHWPMQPPSAPRCFVYIANSSCLVGKDEGVGHVAAELCFEEPLVLLPEGDDAHRHSYILALELLRKQSIDITPFRRMDLAHLVETYMEACGLSLVDIAVGDQSSEGTVFAVRIGGWGGEELAILAPPHGLSAGSSRLSIPIVCERSREEGLFRIHSAGVVEDRSESAHERFIVSYTLKLAIELGLPVTIGWVSRHLDSLRRGAVTEAESAEVHARFGVIEDMLESQQRLLDVLERAWNWVGLGHMRHDQLHACQISTLEALQQEEFAGMAFYTIGSGIDTATTALEVL